MKIPGSTPEWRHTTNRFTQVPESPNMKKIVAVACGFAAVAIALWITLVFSVLHYVGSKY